jgi:hypothetical protein
MGEAGRIDLSEDALHWRGRREGTCRVRVTLPESAEGEASVEGAEGSESTRSGGGEGDEEGEDEEEEVVLSKSRGEEEVGTEGRMESSMKIERQQEAIVWIHTPRVPWYQRLFFVVKIPYDVLHYILTGHLYFGWHRGE